MSCIVTDQKKIIYFGKYSECMRFYFAVKGCYELSRHEIFIIRKEDSMTNQEFNSWLKDMLNDISLEELKNLHEKG